MAHRATIGEDGSAAPFHLNHCIAYWLPGVIHYLAIECHRRLPFKIRILLAALLINHPSGVLQTKVGRPSIRLLHRRLARFGGSVPTYARDGTMQPDQQSPHP